MERIENLHNLTKGIARDDGHTRQEKRIVLDSHLIFGTKYGMLIQLAKMTEAERFPAKRVREYEKRDHHGRHRALRHGKDESRAEPRRGKREARAGKHSRGHGHRELYSIFSAEDTDVFLDAGGDDVGATALGTISREIREAGYEMLYVVNRYRVLSTTPEETVPLLREIEAASHLRATAVDVFAADGFGKEAASLCGLPLLYSTIPDFAVSGTLPEGYKPVKRYVRFVWEDAPEIS